MDKTDGGLYRDDGLEAVNNSNGPLMDELRKKIIALIKEENLSITIDTNLDETDFLDVTFNLKTGKYFPFRKPKKDFSVHQLQIQSPNTNNQRTF